MPALNRVQLIGYLGKDPESRFTPTGKKVTHFSLGVTHRWKSDGETRESTDWMFIEAWERLGDICEQYLHKGSLVYVEGRLKVDRFEDKGEIRYSTRVVAQQIQMLDRKGGDEAGMSVEENPADYDA